MMLLALGLSAPPSLSFIRTTEYINTRIDLNIKFVDRVELRFGGKEGTEVDLHPVKTVIDESSVPASPNLEPEKFKFDFSKPFPEKEVSAGDPVSWLSLWALAQILQKTEAKREFVWKSPEPFKLSGKGKWGEKAELIRFELTSPKERVPGGEEYGEVTVTFVPNPPTLR